jgi:hypothetical protein
MYTNNQEKQVEDFKGVSIAATQVAGAPRRLQHFKVEK